MVRLVCVTRGHSKLRPGLGVLVLELWVATGMGLHWSGVWEGSRGLWEETRVRRTGPVTAETEQGVSK